MGQSVWPDGKTSVDWYSIAGLGLEFEEVLNCKLQLHISFVENQGKPDLLLTLTSVQKGAPAVGPAPSAYVQYHASATRAGSLRAAIFFLLYQMDFESGREGSFADRSKKA